MSETIKLISSLSKYNQVAELESAQNVEDQLRYKLFLQILDKLCLNQTHTLKNTARHQCYHFGIELETEENRKWVIENWSVIVQNFRTNDIYRIKNSDRLVCNVIRHAVKWLNNYYYFTSPIDYQVKKNQNQTRWLICLRQ